MSPSAAGRTPWWRVLLVNVAVTAVTLLVCALAGEVAVRATIAKRLSLTPRYHTDAHYGDFVIRRLRPSTTFQHTTADGTFEFRTNRQGYRGDADFAYDKPAGTVRVLSLGDSNCEGFEVRQEYTFSAVLERLLRKRGLRAEVYNTGVSGFSTSEELVFLENEGVKYRPDYVVLAFASNDPEDNFKTGLYAVRGDTLAVTGHVHVPGVRIQNLIYRFGIVRWLGEHSYLYSLAFNTVWDTLKLRMRRAAHANATRELAVETQPVTEVTARLATKLVARMREVCHAHGARLIVLDVTRIMREGDTRPAAQGPLADSLRANCDVFLGSEDFIARWDGLAELHVAHGTRHISEFSHAHFADAIGEVILRERPPAAP